jgi:hypothetical protein
VIVAELVTRTSPGSVVGEPTSEGVPAAPSSPELMVVITRPAATSANTTQAVAPPTSHGPGRDRLSVRVIEGVTVDGPPISDG